MLSKINVSTNSLSKWTLLSRASTRIWDIELLKYCFFSVHTGMKHGNLKDAYQKSQSNTNFTMSGYFGLVCFANTMKQGIDSSLAKGLWVAILGRIVRPWKISSIRNAVS